MNDVDTGVPARGGRLVMPRSRGATSGILLVLLGAWGALIPFVGPYIDWAYTPDQEWTWTTARGWLEVLPGAVTAVGGLLLLVSRNRATAMLGGWLTVLGGAWFVVGPILGVPLNLGNPGSPVATSTWKVALLEITYLYGLGALIVFLGAIALGRLSVRSLRDVRYAQQSGTAAIPPQSGTAAVPRRPAAEPAPAAEHAEGVAPGEAAPPSEAQTQKVPATPGDEQADREQPRRRFGGLFGRGRERREPSHSANAN